MKSRRLAIAAALAASAVGVAVLTPGAQADQGWWRCPPGTHDHRYCEHHRRHHHHGSIGSHAPYEIVGGPAAVASRS
jgi:hypothetical protein